MRLQIGDHEYMVHFTHLVDEDKLWNRTTICSVHEGKCKTNSRPCETENMSHGMAHSSRKDNFNRPKGRKIALERALATFPVGVRRLLWIEYAKKARLPEKAV